MNLTSYLFGPQASALIGHHILPFGHFLLGKADVKGQSAQGRPYSASPVAMGWGGGVDVVVDRDTSLRLAEVDNFINLLPHTIVRQNNFRLTLALSSASAAEKMHCACEGQFDGGLQTDQHKEMM